MWVSHSMIKQDLEGKCEWKEGCEKRVFVSFSRENRILLFCGYISDFASVYHLILLVPPSAASGIESVQSSVIAANQDDVQVLVTPVQIWILIWIPVPGALLWTLYWMQVPELSEGFWEQDGKRRRVIVEMPLFTSVMQLHLSSSTFSEQVLKSASISFCHELFIPYGWGWLGFGFHRQVYYAHLAPTALACSKPQLFSQHLFLAFIVLDVKTFGLCNSALVLGVRV